MKKIFFTILTVFSLSTFSQQGKDGAGNITGTTIVNSYTTLFTDATANSSSITVTAVTGLAGGGVSTLTVGDLIMIHQTQGLVPLVQTPSPPFWDATSSGPYNSTYGEVYDYNNSGNNEYAEILSISGNTLTLSCPLKYSYLIAGKTQVVRVPRYSSLDISASGIITCPQWTRENSYGGIIALEVHGNTTIAAGCRIDASGLGFRGGAWTGKNTAAFGSDTWGTTTNSAQAINKGESAGGDSTYIGGFQGKYGKGAVANAGGGGCSNNAGGGGGANGGVVASWTGTGNPDRGAGNIYDAAWNRETTGFATTTSSGGGRGGYSYSKTNTDPSLYGPGHVNWSTADQRRNVGGYGGRPLDYSFNRLFLGGGGGSGDGDNNYQGAGGNGGGIIYFMSYGTITGGGQIVSNGADGSASYTAGGRNGESVGVALVGRDGAGGAGGGGAIVVNSTGNVSGISINANGGKGGDQEMIKPIGTYRDAYGPGGGGGGGYVGVSSTVAVVPTVNGGNNGIHNYLGGSGNNMIEANFPPNGATKGGTGGTGAVTIFSIATTGATICSGNTAVLTATLNGTVPAPISVDWYTTPSGGTPVATGTTSYTTAVLTATTTYYVGTCPGIYREPVTVTVTSAPAAPTVTTPVTYCQNATATALTATAGGGNSLLWWGTASSGGTSSGTATTPSTATVGSTTYYVSQTSGSCEGPRNSIVVNITNPPAAPATAPVSYCQNAAAVALTATPTGGNSLLWWGTASSGGTSSGTAPTPSTATVGTTTYYVSQTTGSCESTRSSIIVTINAIPAAPAVADSVSYCQNQAATQLTPNGAGITWYTTPTGGVGGAAPTPSTASTGTTTYYASQTVSGCEGPRDSIKVVVNTSFAIPTASDPTYCVGDLPAQLTATGTGTLNWWGTSAVGGTSSATAPTPSTASAGTVSYYVSQGSGSCESGREQINVLVNAIPATPIGTDANYCQNAGASTVSATGTGTLNWYTVSTGGVGSATAPTPSTASVGTVSYYVSQTVNGCESTRDQVDVIVNAIPTTPTVTDTISYCQNAAASALTATGSGTLNWYTVPTGGAGSGTAPTPATGSTGTTSYYVSQTVNGCESARDTINVVVNSSFANPAASDPTYCVGDVPAQLAATGTGTLNWWGTSATGGTSSATAPTPSTSSAGTVSYYVSQGSGSCESGREQIDVLVNAIPTTPVGTDTNYCLNDVASIVSATGTGTLNWYTVSTGGVSSPTAPTPSTATTGTVSYYVSQTENGCESTRDQIDIIVNAIPTTPSVIDTIGYCQNATASALTATGTGTLNWYTVSTGGAGSATAPTPATGSIGTTSYYVSQTVNGCESARDTINVVVNSSFLAPASANVNYCENDVAAILTANGTTTLNWWGTSATGGTSSATAPTPSTATAGTTSYYVSQGSGSCESPRTQIDVVVTATPATPSGTDINYCMNDASSVLTATGAGTLNWYTASTGGTGTTTALTPSTGIAGTTSYYVSQTIGACESNRDQIDVVVNAIPSTPIVTDTISYCQNSTATPLSATGTGTLNWYTVSTGGTASGTAPTPSTASTGITSYYVSQTENGCEGARDTINVVVNSTLLPPSVSNVNYCEGTTASILSATGTSTLNWWGTSASGGTSSATAPTPSTSTPGTTSYFVSQGSGSCESNRAQIDVVVAPTPIAPTGTDVSYCQNETPTALSATGTGTLNWYTVSTGGVGSTTAPIPSTASVGNTDYYVSQTTGSCEGPRDIITVSVINLQNAPTVSNTGYCTGAVASALTATGTSTLNWWGTSASGGTSSATAPTPSTASAGTTTYYVSQGTGACESPRAAIVVTVDALPTVSFTPVISSVCVNSCIQFSETISPSGLNLSWNFGDGSAVSTSSNPQHCYTAAGGYNVSLTVSTGSGCSATSSVTNAVTVTPGANAQISVNPGSIVSLGTSITFTADTGSAQINYAWNFADIASGSANTSTVYNPTHTYSALGIYCVKLIADASPCKDTAIVCVEVIKEAAISIPNVFTPNNDGLNDMFSVTSSGMKNLEANIFDRWGILLYSWEGVTGSWDGKAKNGKAATNGVYYYVIQATDFKNETKQYSGFIQLLAND